MFIHVLLLSIIASFHRWFPSGGGRRAARKNTR